VLVVGAGQVAARKIDRLLTTGAEITVVAPRAVPEISQNTDLVWLERPYQRGEVASYRLAFTSTGVPAVDGQVFADGEATGVWVNSADDVDNCSFVLPASARRGPLTVSVATEGTSPALASWLRRRYERDLDEAMVSLAELLAEARSALRDLRGSTEHSGWHTALDAGLLDTIRDGRIAEARTALHAQLGLATATPHGGDT